MPLSFERRKADQFKSMYGAASCLTPAFSLVDVVCFSREWKNKLGRTVEYAIVPENGSLADLSFDWRLSSAQCTVSGPFSAFNGFSRILVQLPSAPAPSASASDSKAAEVKMTLTHKRNPSPATAATANNGTAGAAAAAAPVPADSACSPFTSEFVPFAPYAFDGAWDTYATITGPLRDVGLLYRSGVCAAHLDCVRLLPSATSSSADSKQPAASAATSPSAPQPIVSHGAHTRSLTFTASNRCTAFVYCVSGGLRVTAGTSAGSELAENELLLVRCPLTAASASVTQSLTFTLLSSAASSSFIVGDVSYL